MLSLPSPFPLPCLIEVAQTAQHHPAIDFDADMTSARRSGCGPDSRHLVCDGNSRYARFP